MIAASLKKKKNCNYTSTSFSTAIKDSLEAMQLKSTLPLHYYILMKVFWDSILYNHYKLPATLPLTHEIDTSK